MDQKSLIFFDFFKIFYGKAYCCSVQQPVKFTKHGNVFFFKIVLLIFNLGSVVSMVLKGQECLLTRDLIATSTLRFGGCRYIIKLNIYMISTAMIVYLFQHNFF